MSAKPEDCKQPLAARFLATLGGEAAQWHEPLTVKQDATTLRIYDASGALVVCLGTSQAAVMHHTGSPKGIHKQPGID
jgi:hypothetical protein